MDMDTRQAKKPEEEQKESLFDDGPGPAAFMLPPTIGFENHDKTRKQAPAYSISGKLPSQLVGTKDGPGPNNYLIPHGMTAKGPTPLRGITLKTRTKVNENFGTSGPGPAAYYPDINVNRRKPPAYGITSRIKYHEQGDDTPGPIYLLPPMMGSRIPNKRSGEECTIKGRNFNIVKEMEQSPGPIYPAVDPNVTKRKGGEVTLKGRWNHLKSQSAGHFYDIQPAIPRCYRNAPAFSFGRRHSKRVGNFLTNADKVENDYEDPPCEPCPPTDCCS